jgi:hypothetical protein
MENFFRTAAKMALRLAPIAFIPLTLSTTNAFFWTSKLKPNKMDNRVHISVL